MEWLLAIGSAVVGFLVGLTMSKGGEAQMRAAFEKTERDRIEAEVRYLYEIRRGLAQALFADDPQALLDAHATVADFQRLVRDGPKERIEAERTALALKYPRFEEFDLFGLRHFVPTDPQQYERREIVERYVDVGKFGTILEGDRYMAAAWKEEHLARDRQVLERAIERAFDHNAIAATKEAMGRYYAWRRPDDALDAVYEDRDYRVERLFRQYTPETEYGVTQKANGIRTICSVYVWDDGSGKVSHNYRLSDERFEDGRHMFDR